MTRRIRGLTLLACALAGCQVITKLDDLEFRDEMRPDDITADAMPPAPRPDANVSDAAPTPAEDDGPSRVGDEGESRRCRIADGADCDLAEQCGCDEGEHCQARGEANRPTCVAPGNRPKWSSCGRPDECPAGQTCDRGSCRDYCSEDADCEGGLCLPAAGRSTDDEAAIKVCWKKCDLAQSDACAEGTACRSTKTPFAESGAFCVAPFDPCPTTEDGRCDEDRGMGSCANGTDKKDCECSPKLRDATCDPVAQCGCAAGNTCEALVIENLSVGPREFTAKCTPAGAVHEHQHCSDTFDCAEGLFCKASSETCERFCRSNVECGKQAACLKLLTPSDPELGFCTRRCERVTNQPCAGSEKCMSLELDYLVEEPGDYCFQPAPECETNGVCEEPEGTGRCLEGTDVADCCTLEGGLVCNPAEQCGCKPEQQCEVMGDTFEPACTPRVENAVSVEQQCEDYVTTRPCQPGSTCLLGACRQYCDEQPDCGEFRNQCFKLDDENGVELEFGTCMKVCNFADNGPCADGLVCASYSSGLAYCVLPEMDCAEMQGNGQCDDQRPGGTRICAGTDADCE